MKCHKLETFPGGWIFGHFLESLCDVGGSFELAIRTHEIGDHRKRHYHKCATEWVVVVCGKITLNQTEYQAGDIIQIAATEVVEFACVEKATIVVVKIPSVPNDKYEN